MPGPVRLTQPEASKVEIVCLNAECESVVDWGAGEPFRHVMLVPGTDQRCPACDEPERFRVQRVVHESHRFALGTITHTPGFQRAVERHVPLPDFRPVMLTFISRHVHGEWGGLDDHDRRVNEASIGSEARPAERRRLLSRYLVGDEAVYVITEAGRHNTGVLLASEY